jgi:hypothetical protein|tara:strand:- start:1574 stop:1798 length:225 start_codon:yes stop_codon:yes gene_type:complete
MNISKEVYTYIKTKAEADKAKALLSLELLGNNAVGIGDHSTGDFYKNIDEAFEVLCDALDKLETLEKNFDVEWD